MKCSNKIHPHHTPSGIRLVWLDGLRGFLIFLVVLGHCIQYTITNFEDDFLFNFIYSFHMPLFMFISGFVSFREENNWRKDVYKRFKQLIIPFFVYTAIGALVKLDVCYLTDTVLHPERGLWFLWVLFFIIIVNTISEQLAGAIRINKSITDLFFFVALFLCGKYINIFCIPNIAKFYLYFSLGYHYRKYGNYLNKVEKYYLFPGVVWIVLFLYMYCSQNILNSIEVLVKLIIAISAIFFIFVFSKRNSALFSNFTTSIGKDTLGIYSIHWYALFAIPLWKFTTINICIYGVEILMAVVLTALCYYLIIFLKKWKVSSILLIGK